MSGLTGNNPAVLLAFSATSISSSQYVPPLSGWVRWNLKCDGESSTRIKLHCASPTPGGAKYLRTTEDAASSQQSQCLSDNVEESMVEVVKSRGGTVRNVCGLTTSYLDKTRSVSPELVRHENCLLLLPTESRCTVCQKCRNSLRAMKCNDKSRRLAEEQMTSHSSRTNYRCLRREQVIERIRSLWKAKKNLQRGNQRLKKKLEKIIKKEGVQLHEEDANDLEQLLQDSRKKLGESFQHIFWEQQCPYNRLKKQEEHAVAPSDY